ncbi:MAG: protein translocase subunit SecD [bacterium]|nr:protein translocase subunit SecD [bacterium]
MKKRFNIKNMGWKIALILAAMVLSVWLATPPGEKIKLGLDLKGGMHLVMKVEVDKAIKAREGDDPGQLEKLRKHCIRQSIKTIRDRIDEYGVKDAGVQQLGSHGEDKILVTMPGVDEPGRVKDLIKNTAMLEFKHVAAGPFDTEAAAMEHYGGNLPEELTIRPTNPKRMEPLYYVLTAESVVTGDDLKKASAGRGEFGAREVHFNLNSHGAERFKTYTAANIGNSMAIVFDDHIESVAAINEVLSYDTRIIGKYPADEVSDMVLKLQSGALAAPMTPVEERVIGPSLGADSIQKGIKAVITGLVLVMLFMVLYYRAAGVNAVAALLLNLLLLMGAMAYMGFTLTLPGIAGIILTIGMAVDANVLIFERIKEELKNGKSTAAAIDAGFKKAFVTVLDANLTTVIAAVFLLQFGTGTIKGFAVTLIIGICASMFTALFVSRVIFQLAYAIKGKKENNWRPLGGTSWAVGNAHFMNRRARTIAALISAAVILLGGFTYFTKGFNQGIDFTGGIMMELSFKEKAGEHNLRNALKKAGIEGVSIQRMGKEGSRFLVKTAVDSPQTGMDISDAAVEKIKTAAAGVGDFEMLSLEMVGPQVGADLKYKVIRAAVWALMGMLIYIGLRFKPVYGLAAVLTLIHDILVCLTVLMLFNVEISLQVVAALLTVIGYSLNDTIVIFDRVRDNLKSKGKVRGKELEGVLNRSINQTLGRTVVTSGTTMAAVLALLFLGGDVLYPFSFTLAVGILVGTFSSIFQSCAYIAAVRGSKQKFLRGQGPAARGAY